MAEIKMRRVAQRLGYKTGKPTVYKLKQLTYPPIKEKDLINYISKSSNVPKATIEAAIEAIIEGIMYFVMQGHRVVFDDFGGFYINVRTKTSETYKGLCDDMDKTLISTRLAFASCTELRELIKDTDTKIEVGGVYGETFE